MKRRTSLVLAFAAAPLAVVLGGAGCKGKSAPAGGPPPPPVRDGGAVAPGPGDAGAAVVPGDGDDPGGGDPVGPDETSLRAGKRTGLGAPDEKPEVATEELIEALVGGTVPWTRFIEPSRGVVELELPAETAGPVARRCGAGLSAALDALTTAMKGAATGGLGYALDCDNLGLAGPDPGGAAAAAVCSLESPAAGTIIVDLVFVPDPARGLRLVGMASVPAEADAAAALPLFEAEMARVDGRCP